MIDKKTQRVIDDMHQEILKYKGKIPDDDFITLTDMFNEDIDKIYNIHGDNLIKVNHPFQTKLKIVKNGVVFWEYFTINVERIVEINPKAVTTGSIDIGVVNGK